MTATARRSDVVPAAFPQRRHRAAGRLASLGGRSAAEPQGGSDWRIRAVRACLAVLPLHPEPSSGNAECHCGLHDVRPLWPLRPPIRRPVQAGVDFHPVHLNWSHV